MKNNNVYHIFVEKVSIIIPIYNLECFADKTLQSVCSQTYENIEIIVVNDASSDNSINIINKYAKKDKRIKVINHSKNMGISAARNSGLNIATGDYIIFVDGDDWLSQDHVEYLLSICIKTKTEIGFGRYNFTSLDSTQSENNDIFKISQTTAYEYLYYPILSIGCWNKIYKKSYIDKYKLSFSPTTGGEGMRFVAESLYHVESVGIGNKKTYYYRLNNFNSATTRPKLKMCLDGQHNLFKVKKELRKISHSSKRALKFHIWNSYCYVLFVLYFNNIIRHHIFLYIINYLKLKFFGLSAILFANKKYINKKYFLYRLIYTKRSINSDINYLLSRK